MWRICPWTWRPRSTLCARTSWRRTRRRPSCRGPRGRRGTSRRRGRRRGRSRKPWRMPSRQKMKWCLGWPWTMIGLTVGCWLMFGDVFGSCFVRWIHLGEKVWCHYCSDSFFFKKNMRKMWSITEFFQDLGSFLWGPEERDLSGAWRARNFLSYSSW